MLSTGITVQRFLDALNILWGQLFTLDFRKRFHDQRRFGLQFIFSLLLYRCRRLPFFVRARGHIRIPKKMRGIGQVECVLRYLISKQRRRLARLFLFNHRHVMNAEVLKTVLDLRSLLCLYETNVRIPNHRQRPTVFQNTFFTLFQV